MNDFYPVSLDINHAVPGDPSKWTASNMPAFSFPGMCRHLEEFPLSHPRMGYYETGGECFKCGAKWRTELTTAGLRRFMLTGEEADD